MISNPASTIATVIGFFQNQRYSEVVVAMLFTKAWTRRLFNLKPLETMKFASILPRQQSGNRPHAYLEIARGYIT